MGSAKTALLLTTAYNFEERNMPYICFKPVIDTREQRNVIRSRIGIERACHWIYAETNLYEFISRIFKEVEVRPLWILVDEAQFLSERQVDELASVVDDFGCNVLCFGLRTDFRTNLFEGSRRLFEIADSIEEVKSTCNCGRKTIVNARIDSKGEILTKGEQVEIGGNDKYVAVCRKCWRNRRIESSARFQLPLVFSDDVNDNSADDGGVIPD